MNRATPDDQRGVRELLDDISKCFVPGGAQAPKNVIVVNRCDIVGALLAVVLAQHGVGVYTIDSMPKRADIPGCTNISPGTKIAQIKAEWCGQFIGQPRMPHLYARGHVWTTLRRGPLLVFVHGDEAAYSSLASQH